MVKTSKAKPAKITAKSSFVTIVVVMKDFIRAEAFKGIINPFGY